MKRTILLAMAAVALLASCERNESPTPELDKTDFVEIQQVVPSAILEIRYYSTYNFVGRRIDGYHQPTALLTREAADSLKAVADELEPLGYIIKVFDAYRPQDAVDMFYHWAQDPADTLMKPYFYPELDKTELIPGEYICTPSGHSRGSTIDLTLFDMKLERDVDMGCTYDYFGEMSHPAVQPGQQTGYPTVLTQEQYDNRMLLRRVMLAHGFKPLESEWWHFTLKDEPHPDTYFNFPVALDDEVR